MLGYHPQVILAGRRINDGMGKFIAEQTVKQMIQSGSHGEGRARHRARPHVQGKLPGHPQFARHRRRARARVVRRERARPRPGGRPPRGACTNTASTLDPVGRTAAGARRSSRPSRTALSSDDRSTIMLEKVDAGGLYVDVKMPGRRRDVAGARHHRCGGCDARPAANARRGGLLAAVRK